AQMIRDAGPQIDYAVISEAPCWNTCLRVERDQPPVSSAEQDARRSLLVARPKGDAAVLAAVRLRIVLPNLLAGLRIEGHDALVLRREVHHAIDDDSGCLEAAASLAGMIRPGALQLRHVFRVDLV